MVISAPRGSAIRERLFPPAVRANTAADAVHRYATELANEQDSAPQRRAARLRLLDHYLHTGHDAAMLLLLAAHARTHLRGVVLAASDGGQARAAAPATAPPAGPGRRAGHAGP